MTVANCSSKKTGWVLLRRLLRQNLRAGVLIFGLVFLIHPLQYLWGNLIGDYFSGAAYIYTDLSQRLCFLLILLFWEMALTQMKWLHTPRAVDLFHSLPVSREALLLANAGAAFLTVAIPVGLNYLIILAVGFGNRGRILPSDAPMPFLPGEILLDYCGWMVTGLTIVAAVALTATLVGRRLENLLFSAMLLVAPFAVCLLTGAVLQSYLIGWPMWMAFEDLMVAACPLLIMFYRGEIFAMRGWGGLASANWLILIWAALSCLLLWLACRCCKKRPSEQADTSGAGEPLNSLGRLAVVYLGGMFFGMLAHEMSWWPSPQDPTMMVRWFPFPLAVFLCGMAAALLWQLVIGRGFAGLKRAILPMAGMAAAVAVAAWAICSGGLGYADRVPDPASLESVGISYQGRYWNLARVRRSTLRSDDREVTLTDPEGIRLVTEIHRDLIQRQQSAGEKRWLGGVLSFWYSNGMTRSFSQNISDRWQGPARNLELLLDLEENLELRQQTDPRFTVLPEDVTSIRVSDVTGLSTTAPIRDKEAVRTIIEAAKADAWTTDYAAFREGSARAAAYLAIETRPIEDYGEVPERTLWRDFRLPVYQGDENTLAALEELGLGSSLLPRTERVEKLLVEWWPDPTNKVGAYWSGIGPCDLDPVGDPCLPEYNYSEDELFEEPEQIEELLSLCLGADCHPSTPGFLITVMGKDRQGSTFWLSREDAPAYVEEWFQENAHEFEGRGMRWHGKGERYYY